MKITLSELKQFIKNVIKESILSESNNPPMGGATDLFINNGYEVSNSTGNVKFKTIELKKDDKTIILKSSPNTHTIQINTSSNPQGKVIEYNTIEGRQFRGAVIGLKLVGLDN